MIFIRRITNISDYCDHAHRHIFLNTARVSASVDLEISAFSPRFTVTVSYDVVCWCVSDDQNCVVAASWDLSCGDGGVSGTPMLQITITLP